MHKTISLCPIDVPSDSAKARQMSHERARRAHDQPLVLKYLPNRACKSHENLRAWSSTLETFPHKISAQSKHPIDGNYNMKFFRSPPNLRSFFRTRVHPPNHLRLGWNFVWAPHSTPAPTIQNFSKNERGHLAHVPKRSPLTMPKCAICPMNVYDTPMIRHRFWSISQTTCENRAKIWGDVPLS